MKEKEEKYIGIFGGSFNPPHKGHTGLAIEILDHHPEISEIWFMVAKQNPLKSGYGVSFQDRFEMTKLACEEDPRLVPCDIEASLESTYTVDVLGYLRERWPNLKFALIIGEDSYNTLEYWKNPQEILDNHRVYVYERQLLPPSNKPLTGEKDVVLISGTKKFEISSSKIRLSITEPPVLTRVYLDKWLNLKVADYIRDRGFYL